MNLKFITILFLNLLLLFVSQHVSSQGVNTIDSLEQLLKQKDISVVSHHKTLNRLSNIYYKNEEYLKAIQYKNKELRLYEKRKKDSLVAMANERLGMMYYHLGNYSMASKYFIKSLSFFEQHNNLAMISQICGNLANVYTRIENHSKALDYLYRSKGIDEQAKNTNKNTLVALYTNIGLAYSDSDQLDSAMFYYNKALRMDLDNPLYRASILNNIGEVRFKEKQYDKALSNYQKAKELFIASNNDKGLGAAISNIAKVKLVQKKYTEAIMLSQEAMGHLKKVNSLFFITTAQHQLYEAYKGQKKFKKALQVLEDYISLDDSLKGTKTTDFIASQEMQYAHQKDQQKFMLLEQEKLLAEKETKLKETKLYITIIGFAALLLFAMLIVFYLRIRLQKNKLKQVVLKQNQEKLKTNLAFKQKEIESFASYLKEKNNLLENLKAEIKLEKTGDEFLNKKIHTLTNIINQNLHIDKDRKKLELKIDQEHQEFVNRLSTIHQNLTKNEVRLCSLLLLDLSTKEIASALNIENTSVKMNKNRLRKKLKLDKGSNIKTYLDSI